MKMVDIKQWNEVELDRYIDKVELMGKIDGMSSMKKMVLTVFAEHPEMTTEQIKNYIKDNL